MCFARLRQIAPAAGSFALAVGMLSLLLLLSSPVTHAMEEVSAFPQELTVYKPELSSTLQQTATNAYTVYLPLIAKPAYLYLPLVISNRPFAYSYGFADPGCDGWVIHSFNLNEPDPPGPWSAGCGKEKTGNNTTIDQGVYNVKTGAAWNSWIYTAPVVLADPAYFTLQVDGKSAQTFMWASSWGLYFNANATRRQFYTLQIFQDSDGESAPTLEVRRWDYFEGDADDPNVILLHRRCVYCARGDFEWTQMRVVRAGTGLYIYAGGALLNIIHAPEYMSSSFNGIGIYQGNFEWNDFNPSRYGEPAFQMDNFIAEPVFRR